MAEIPSDLGMPPFASAVRGESVVLCRPDPDHDLDGVRLWVDQEIDVPREFDPVPQGWRLELPLPPVGRLEYLFESVSGTDTALGVDPTNPRRVAGAFGDHSWLPMPGYTEPAWLSADVFPGDLTDVSVPTADGTVTGRLWAPLGADGDPLPLLISHDGPEMDAYGRLTWYVAAGIRAGSLPAMRVALLAPGPERDTRYGADDGYADALVGEVLPALAEERPVRGRPVLMGQSLGGLAALHAAWRHRDTFAAVFAQSGSFFTPETDPQESGFRNWASIVAFTTAVHRAAGSAPLALPPVGLVCGRAEENLANNLLLASDLTRAGVEVSWGDLADGHTWTCWRDLLDPHLGELLRRVWPTR